MVKSKTGEKMSGRNEEIAQALWYVAPGRAEIRAEPVPPPAPGVVRVRAVFGALSRGTEALVLAGRVPESEFDRMRPPFMGGAFPFPVKYGYAVVGRIEAGPPELIERTVFVLHPHQTLFNVPAEAVVRVPNGVPPVRAVLTANMETALNALWDAGPGPADRIAIVGGGAVGALVAMLCSGLAGAEVTLVDVSPARAEVAKKLGVGFALPERASGECDLVIHVSGTAAGLASAIRLAGEEATVAEVSWYGAGEVPIPLGGAFHSRRLRILSSQVGRVAASHRPRWTPHRRLSAAAALLSDGRIDALLAPPVAFGELPARLPDILDTGTGVLCQVIAYP